MVPMNTPNLSSLLFTASVVFVAWTGCSSERVDIGTFMTDTPAAPPLGAADASTSPTEELKSYCPSNRCPPGHTTCPSSQFLCDVDLLTDVNNCGECGNMCPGNRKYSCLEGRCVLNCNSNQELDCDGLPDNGCETSADSNDNCGYCGNKCPADKPCIDRGITDFACGCKPGELNCGGPAPCIDPSQDDENCGACGNACPPDGDGTVEAPPNMYFGCFDGECGVLKCSALFGNCDGRIDNGCETYLVDDDHCGICKNRCQDGTTCGRKSLFAPITTCHCPKGTTFCGAVLTQGGVEVEKIGECRDLTSDRENCGACGNICTLSVPNADEGCVYGECAWSCKQGWGDCNGSRDDGCETNTSSDPKNCGGCGVACDGIAGQACIGGQCMIEPCDELQDAGGPPR